jgi:two-component system, NtrC family, response regulator AtoC
MTRKEIIVIEDDPVFARMLRHRLTMDPDYDVQICQSGKDALTLISTSTHAVTLDINLPDYSGLELMRKLKQKFADLPILVISGQEDLNLAIEIFREGAYDYIYKDDHVMERLWQSIHNATHQTEIKQELKVLRDEVADKYNIQQEIKGASQEMQRVFSLIEKTLQTSINVLITGETGTGKELVARAIHFNSNRKTKPFVAVNVAAIPKELIESELFGHEKGAFTGAINSRMGLLEEAKGGTLFLDEIGEMELSMQAKLLRVLQEMQVTRVGSNKAIPLEFRLIVATHRNLREEIKLERFREDLYYRMLGVTIELPPLRSRGKDILVLAHYFLHQFAKNNKLKPKELSSAAKKALLQYPFPGNVRELKAMMDTGFVLSDSDIIDSHDIPFSNDPELQMNYNPDMTLEEYTLGIIQQKLIRCKYNVQETANQLDIGKSTIYRFIKEGKIVQR